MSRKNSESNSKKDREVMKRYKSVSEMVEKKDKIWIAEDVCIDCKIKQNWLQRKIIQWLTGWRYEKGEQYEEI